MWERIKSLWAARREPSAPEPVAVVDGAADAEATVEPAPAPEPAAPEPPWAAALATIDEAVRAGNAPRALAVLREVLLEAAGEGAVLERAAAALELAQEEGLAAAFREAVTSQRWEPLAELAGAFLTMADPPLARALAAAARARSGPDEPQTASILAEACAVDGDHGAVVGALARFEGRWPSEGLCQRYALSAVLARDHERWQRVAGEVAASGAGWIGRAADRALAFGDADDAALRRALFVEYGAALLEAEAAAPGALLGPVRIEALVEAAVGAVHAARLAIDRVAYTSGRGEVVARWLADALGVAAVPLSARVPGQRLIVVGVDDEDVLNSVNHPSFDAEPCVLLQLVKDPTVRGVPAPDVIGVIAEGAQLPFEGLRAEKAADRVPPSILSSELRAAARGVAVAPPPELARWIEARRRHLSLVDPPGAEGRLPYLADIPDWARPAVGEAR